MAAFKSTPHRPIIDKNTGNMIGMFNGEGIFRTYDNDLIVRLKDAGIECIDEGKQTLHAFGITVEPSEQTVETEPTEPPKQKKMLVCKICGAQVEHIGALNKHKKEFHKGE